MKVGFAVLGPQIVLEDGKINPTRNGKIPEKKQIKNTIIVTRIKYILTLLGLERTYQKFEKYLKSKGNDKFKHKIENNNNRIENIILHGCCWIFSPSFIEKFDGLNNKTFLYCEEELLFLMIKENNMKTVYNPKIIIFHAEDASTNAITKKERKKRLFIYKNLIKSEKVLYKEVAHYYKNKKK